MGSAWTTQPRVREPEDGERIRCALMKLGFSWKKEETELWGWDWGKQNQEGLEEPGQR